MFQKRKNKQTNTKLEGRMSDYYFLLDVASCPSRPIRLQDIFIIDMFEKNQLISLFFLRRQLSGEGRI